VLLCVEAMELEQLTDVERFASKVFVCLLTIM